MGLIQVGGQIVAGPPSGTGPCQDRAILNVALALKGGAGSKPFQVATGVLQLNINTPTYLTLPGIGAVPNITQADTLYFFSSSPMMLRLTTFGSPDLVSEDPIDGLLIREFPATQYLKLLEIKGNGSIEYFASGPQ